MSGQLYTRDILRLATSIPHLEPIDDPHGSIELRSPTCGSQVSVAVRLGPDGRVAALGQRVEACAFGQASAAIMGRHALGRSAAGIDTATSALSAWLAGAEELALEWPGIELLAPARDYSGRHGAILLPFRALAGAVSLAVDRQPLKGAAASR